MDESNCRDLPQSCNRLRSGRCLAAQASARLASLLVCSLTLVLAQVLRKVGIEIVRIEGHTDNVGSAESNVALPQRRAASVAREFAREGWPDKAMATKGFGRTKPVGDNRSSGGGAENRRVVIIVPAQ